MRNMSRIGRFSTGEGKASCDLLAKDFEEIKQGTIPKSRIVYVFSNREPGEDKRSDKFFDLVSELKIPLVYASSKKFEPQLRKAN